MSSFSKITVQKAIPFPVIVLADTSGSMSVDGKIDALNIAVKEMVRSMGQQERLQAEIHVSFVTFGGEAEELHPMVPAYQFEGEPNFKAGGGTPMGHAFNIARQIVEDKERIPSRAYRPTIVLISDGHPTDAWRGELDKLLKSERASKATRLAMAIGQDADLEILKEFINNSEIPVVKANDVHDIAKFFKCVTMSVTTRSVQANPNGDEHDKLLEIFDDEMDEEDLVF